MKREPPTGNGWSLVERGPDGFAMDSRDGLRLIASYGDGWDHVSVSRRDRAPTWDEMCRVKDLLFDLEDCVIQYHPPRSKYVNIHPFCLHLWRPQGQRIPIPPKWMV